MSDIDVSNTEIPVAPATPAPEVTATPVEQPTEAKPVVPSKTYTEDEFQKAFQKRLGQESRRLERVARAEARAEFAERQLAEKNAPANEPEGPPKPEDFKDYDSFLKAAVKHEVEQRMKGFSNETAQQTQARQQSEYAASVAAKLGASKAKYPDFEEVAYASDVPISKFMAQAIAESESGGDVAYYLGSNVDVAHRISLLPPTQQVREIAKIEAQLSARPATTKTPPPIVPGTGATGGKKSLSEMSDDDYAKTMRKAMGR